MQMDQKNEKNIRTRYKGLGERRDVERRGEAHGVRADWNFLDNKFDFARPTIYVTLCGRMSHGGIAAMTLTRVDSAAVRFQTVCVCVTCDCQFTHNECDLTVCVCVTCDCDSDSTEAYHGSQGGHEPDEDFFWFGKRGPAEHASKKTRIDG